VFNAEDKATETTITSGTGLGNGRDAGRVGATPPVRASDPSLFFVKDKLTSVTTAEHALLTRAVVAGGVESTHATLTSTTNGVFWIARTSFTRRGCDLHGEVWVLTAIVQRWLLARR
jgi:hypothetical protein